MLVESLLEANRLDPHRLAVSDGRLDLTYRRLTLLSRVMRGVVQAHSRHPHIGIMLPACALFPATLFGTLWAGRVAVPLNFLLAGPELARIVRDAGLDCVLTITHFRELAEELGVRCVYLDELPLRRRVLLAMLLPAPAVPRTTADDLAVLLYTSGTTAEPKGVELTHGNLHSDATDAIATLNIPTGQRMLNILPPFHVFGLTGTVLVPVYLRSSVVAIPRFSPLSVLRTVRDAGVTVMMAIPSMYAALLKLKSGGREDFASVQLAISGGEPLPDRVRDDFEARFGVLLHQGYGLTETSPVVSVCGLDSYRAGSVGRPIRGVEVRVVGDEGREVPTGADGELWIRGPVVMKGYYGKPEATAAVLDEEGWFRTGDIGRFDAEGYLYITGRLKEMLIIGGENVFPREIEAALEEHADVVQAAVIGVPDEHRGEAPIAFVIRREGATVDGPTLRTHAKGRLAGFKVPREVHVRDELPLSPTGKILKRKLHELLDERDG
jgi:long-chain acyl-CoA synthetase